MARYASDQFYNFDKYETGYAAPGSGSEYGYKDNPRFLWPSDAYKNAVTGSTQTLKRGYIRMIAEAYGTDDLGKKLAGRRFHFQFNPDVLVRQVNARNDVQFWMNQDPGQLVSPIPGDANFAFEFILNREAEVASGKYNNGSGNTNIEKNMKPRVDASTGIIAGSTSPYGAMPTRYDPTSVSDIGVLADLIVFDSIIGQGVNSDLISSILGKFNANKDAYNSAIDSAQTDSTTDAQDKTKITEETSTKVGEFLSGSVGNSAFLISQPVRIVFSSLYMVEGFITSSTVTFNKFNYAMVPTQCTVSINMQAMYIGFAAKDTFLTTTLRNANAGGGDAVGDPGTNNSDPIADENDALLKIKLYNKTVPAIPPSGNTEDVFLKVSDILKKGSDTTKLTFNASKSDDFEKALKAGYVLSVNASLDGKLTYKGRAGGGTGGGYAVGAVVHTFSNAQDMSDKNKATFEITRGTPSAGAPWDNDSNAQYEFDITITFEMFSPSTSVISKQTATCKKIKKWGEFIQSTDFDLSMGV